MRAGDPTLRTALLAGACAAAALVTACATTPPEEDPVQIKLKELDGRVGKVERVISNQSLVELSQRIDAMQSEVRQLRGRMDELENALQSAHKEQRDLYGDLEKRIAALQGAAPPGTNAAGTNAAGANATGSPAPAAPSASSTDPAGKAAAAPGAAAAAAADAALSGASSVEQALYSQAFAALKAGSYSVAITSFKEFLGSYPASPLAENAQYWLGEAHYVNHDFDAAAAAFRAVLQKWPNGRKAPDAMLKLGYTLLEQKKYSESKATLTELTRKFPDSDAARIAGERLKQQAPRSH